MSRLVTINVDNVSIAGRGDVDAGVQVTVSDDEFDALTAAGRFTDGTLSDDGPGPSATAGLDLVYDPTPEDTGVLVVTYPPTDLLATNTMVTFAGKGFDIQGNGITMPTPNEVHVVRPGLYRLELTLLYTPASGGQVIGSNVEAHLKTGVIDNVVSLFIQDLDGGSSQARFASVVAVSVEGDVTFDSYPPLYDGDSWIAFVSISALAYA